MAQRLVTTCLKIVNRRSIGECPEVSDGDFSREPGTAGPGVHATPGKRILYFADPMCSWCWGFSPVLAEIVRGYGARASVRLVVGGLRPFTAVPLSDKAKASVRHHWEQVQAATGQPFNFGFFERDGFVYDTEPACRAVVACRNLAPARTLEVFAAVQRAFYVDNQDVTSPETLAEIAGSLGVEAAAFAHTFSLQDVIAETRSDFHATQAFGIAGFPAVVLADDDGYLGLTMGWQPFGNLRPTLEQWIGA